MSHTDTMIETEIQPAPTGTHTHAKSSPPEGDASILDLTFLLVGRKRFILRFVLGSAVLATILAFLLPVRYEAKILLLPPQQNSSVGAALLGQLGSAGSLGSLASLAGGSLGLKNQAEMYISLLTSRTVEDSLIQRFELMKEYRKKYM